jgi:hypothetical protein
LDIYLKLHSESENSAAEIKKYQTSIEPFFNEIIKSDFGDARDFFLMHVEIF